MESDIEWGSFVGEQTEGIKEKERLHLRRICLTRDMREGMLEEGQLKKGRRRGSKMIADLNEEGREQLKREGQPLRICNRRTLMMMTR